VLERYKQELVHCYQLELEHYKQVRLELQEQG
jgi:hypothetical protein